MSVATRIASTSLVFYTLLQFAVIWLSLASILTVAHFGAVVYASILLIAAPLVLYISFLVSFWTTVKKAPPYARVIWDVSDFTFMGAFCLILGIATALQHLVRGDNTPPSGLENEAHDTYRIMHVTALFTSLFMFTSGFKLIYGWMFHAYPLRDYTWYYVNGPHFE